MLWLLSLILFPIKYRSNETDKKSSDIKPFQMVYFFLGRNGLEPSTCVSRVVGPPPDPDPGLSVSGFHEADKKYFFLFFCFLLITFEGTFTSVNSHKEVTKQ
jgi:hypothetical protein